MTRIGGASSDQSDQQGGKRCQKMVYVVKIGAFELYEQAQRLKARSRQQQEDLGIEL